MFQIAFAKYLEMLGFGEARISSWGGFGNCLSGLKVDTPYHPFQFKKGNFSKIRFRLFRRYVDKKSPFGNVCNDNGQADIRLRWLLERLGIVANRSLTPPIAYHKSFFRETYVRGWFERPEFVDGVQSWVRQNFVAKTLSSSAKNLIEHITRQEKAVCVSIRRGDFLGIPNRCVCNESWFLRAIDHMTKLIGADAVFYVFSDDPSWCKMHMRIKAHAVFEKEGVFSISDKLSCMCACKHFIISNSTFSWWAQYLGDSPNKIVIAPDKWFKNGNSSYSQRMNNWILLPTAE